jgi:hypothetical protein
MKFQIPNSKFQIPRPNARLTGIIRAGLKSSGRAGKHQIPNKFKIQNLKIIIILSKKKIFLAIMSELILIILSILT